MVLIVNYEPVQYMFTRLQNFNLYPGAQNVTKASPGAVLTVT